jgi:hypothetical protein
MWPAYRRGLPAGGGGDAAPAAQPAAAPWGPGGILLACNQSTSILHDMACFNEQICIFLLFP